MSDRAVITRLPEWAMKGVRRVLRLQEAGTRASIEDALEEDSHEAAEFSTTERDMLRNLLRFRDVRVADIMVPRADIEALDIAMTLDDMMAGFAAGAHSRMPVYRDTLDTPCGFIHIKDIVIALQKQNGEAQNGASNQAPIEAESLLRKILYVPPSMAAIDMLLQMQATRIHMALVIDEYGGTDGLVSIEDVVEEIVGEIEDEHDDPDAVLIKPKAGDATTSEGVWEVHARLPITELEATFSLDFDTAEFADIDTVGGMVIACAGRVPSRGEIVHLSAANGGMLEALICDADARRIRRLEIRLSDPENAA